jgi:hypothetical protein
MAGDILLVNQQISNNESCLASFGRNGKGNVIETFEFQLRVLRPGLFSGRTMSAWAAFLVNGAADRRLRLLLYGRQDRDPRRD